MSFHFKITSKIPATVDTVYNAWLNSKEHAAMTGSQSALVTKKAGAVFTAHDEYIFGKNLILIPGKKIIQTWRTTEFRKSDPDSIVEILFCAVEGATLVTLKHNNVPHMKYKDGWKEYYFKPMKTYFRQKAKATER